LISQSVEFASFENMRNLEAAGESIKYKSSNATVFATGDRQNPEAFHLRKGKVGGYRDYLSPEKAEAYLSRIQQELSVWYGYNG